MVNESRRRHQEMERHIRKRSRKNAVDRRQERMQQPRPGRNSPPPVRTEVRYSDTPTLIELIDDDPRCRAPGNADLDKEGFHTYFPLQTQGYNIRVEVMAKVNGTTDPWRFVLDMDLSEFNRLNVWKD